MVCRSSVRFRHGSAQLGRDVSHRDSHVDVFRRANYPHLVRRKTECKPQTATIHATNRHSNRDETRPQATNRHYPRHEPPPQRVSALQQGATSSPKELQTATSHPRPGVGTLRSGFARVRARCGVSRPRAPQLGQDAPWVRQATGAMRRAIVLCGLRLADGAPVDATVGHMCAAPATRSACRRIALVKHLGRFPGNTFVA